MDNINNIPEELRFPEEEEAAAAAAANRNEEEQARRNREALDAYNISRDDPQDDQGGAGAGAFQERRSPLFDFGSSSQESNLDQSLNQRLRRGRSMPNQGELEDAGGNGVNESRFGEGFEGLGGAGRGAPFIRPPVLQPGLGREA